MGNKDVARDLAFKSNLPICPGLNKDDTIKKYGSDQVKIWRRSFDIPPPKMEFDHPYKNKITSYKKNCIKYIR